MQQQLLADLQERIAANLRAMEPQEMMKLWLAPGLEGFGSLYEAFTRMAGKRE
jgi:hypothetical protein